MMQNPHPAKRRVIALLAFFGAFLLLFAAVLYDAQILHGGENRAKSISSNAASAVLYTRAEAVRMVTPSYRPSVMRLSTSVDTSSAKV